jgi:1,4-dihydroxy-6-naphthoate synthase
MIQPEFSCGFSSCPNDTFMFDALVHGKIDTEGMRFKVVMEDVETLNRMALAGELDITKVSFAAYAMAAAEYQLLNAGSALGRGVGPLVVSLRDLSAADLENGRMKIVTPGRNTTANFLFSLFFPGAKNKSETIFSEIEKRVLNGSADAGIIIHENRFTYAQKGLKKICDLGELWEVETGLPIPLGGIAVKRSLPEAYRQKIDMLVRKSVAYALGSPEAAMSYVRKHAQEMDEEVMRKHIGTYVNDFSVDHGTGGRKAIEVFFQKILEAGIIAKIPGDLFVIPAAITMNPET